MSRPLHRVGRWMRLALACLALVGASVPAHALPTAATVVAVWVERQAPQRPQSVAQAPVHLGHRIPEGARLDARAPSAGGLREVRTPASPRRLFIVHRALLY